MYFLENLLETMIDYVISEADALMYVVLCKAETLLRYVELVGTTECLTLYSKCRKKRGRYKRFRLYFVACGDTWNGKTFQLIPFVTTGLNAKQLYLFRGKLWKVICHQMEITEWNYRERVNVLSVVLSRD